MSDPVAAGNDVDLLATSQAGPAAVRGGAMRVAGFAVGAALSVVSASLMFRYLGVRDSGRYVTVTTLVLLFVSATDAGLQGLAVRELAAGTRPRTFMRDVVGLRIALSVSAAFAAVGFAAVAGYTSTMVVGAALVGVGLVLLSIQATWSAALVVRMRFAWVTSLDLIRQVVAVGCIVVLVLIDGGLLWLLALGIPAALVVLVPTVLLVRGDVPLRPRFDRASWRRLALEVLPFAAATAVAALYFRVSLILVSLVCDAQQTGYFGASFRVVEVLVVIPSLMVGAALPIFARAAAGDHERLRFGIQRVVNTTAIAGAALVLGVFVGAQDIIAILAGSDFAPAASVLQIQCLALLATFVSTVWGTALLSLGRYRSILILVSVPLVVNVVLTLALAPGMGARGGAIATVIGEVLLALMGAVMVARAIAPLRLVALPVLRVLALALPFGALVLVGGVPPLVLAALATGLYVLTLWALGWLPPDLLKDLRGT